MKLLNHPHVIKLVDTIQTKTHLYIVTELAKGVDLFDYVQQYENLREYDSAFIIGQVILAVIYLNSLGLVHRDLKPENIMVY
jgi:calcium-dependent protein kinase